MHNPVSDNELDELSRDAAGHYQPPGLPDWEKMSSELDKHMPVEKRKRRFGFWWWLLPLATGAGMFWLFSNTERTSSSTPSAAQTVHAAAADNNSTTVPSQQNTTGNTSTTDTKEKGGVSVTVSKQVFPGLAAKGISSATIRKKASAHQPDAAGDLTLSVDKQKQDIAQQASKTNPSFPGPAGSTGLPVVQPAQDNTGNNVPRVEQNKTTETASLIQPETIKTEVTPDSSAPVAPANVEKNTRALKEQGKGFSAGLVAGIDMSTVKLRYGRNPGINIGIIGGYHFNKRFSLHTGVIYTQKNYRMAGSDFTAPKGSWLNYYKLTNVEGYCRMFEIPVQARYAFGPDQKKRYFLSAGLSSYFMTKENYDFTWYYLGNPVTRNAEYNTSDQHILAILDLSVGFEKRLSNSLSLQIEPYAKLPMGGLGTGQIRLSSFGVNFGLQLRQPAAK